MEKTADAFRTISEVAEDLDLPQHVLRFWETRFTQIRPLKRGGGRRYYRREDIDLLRAIRQLLYGEGYTIKGVQKILKEQGVRGVIAGLRGEADLVPAEELPVEIGSDHVGPELALPNLLPRAQVQDLLFETLNQTIAAAHERTLGPADFKALETLLAELNECERLLGNARRAPGPQ